MPVITMESTMLRAVPGQRWQVVTYLNNNSGQAVEPVLECRFTNHGEPVAGTKVMVSQIGPGVRAGIAVMGPRVNYFVDKASCLVASP
jgi:hypothetical protein